MKPATRQTILWISVGLNVAFCVALASIAFFPDASVRIIATEAHAATAAGDHRPHRDGDKDHGGGDPMQREFNRIAKVLDLQPEQRDRIQKMMDDGKTEGRSLFSQMKDERVKAFRTILEQPNDDATFSHVIDHSHDIHEAMAVDMLSRFRAIARELTEEQRAKLLKEFDDWDSKEDERRPPDND
ncbi:MAG: Spy/CpxP family protein refolding chaperone [Candidatus Sumerlaeota bacterium]